MVPPPKNTVTVRFGRVMDQEELSTRLSEFTPEQYQALVQVTQTNIEEIGSMIDGPALDDRQRTHLAGGLYWTRTLLEKFVSLRTNAPKQKIESIFLGEI